MDVDFAAQLADAEARGEVIGRAKGETNVVRRVLHHVIIATKAIVAAVDLLLKRGRYDDVFVLQTQLEVISKLHNDLQDKATSLGLQPDFFEKRSFMGVQLQCGRSGQRRKGCSGNNNEVLWPQNAASTACDGNCMSEGNCKLNETSEMSLDEAKTLLKKTLVSLKQLSIQCFLVIGLDACGYKIAGHA